MDIKKHLAQIIPFLATQTIATKRSDGLYDAPESLHCVCSETIKGPYKEGISFPCPCGRVLRFMAWCSYFDKFAVSFTQIN